MFCSWASVIAHAQAVVDNLRWGQFLVVEYDQARLGEESPYAQAACGPGGWHAEVVSDFYLPWWHQDECWLAAAGWRRPEPGSNWQREMDRPEGLGAVLIEGLESGRGCLLPELFTVRAGRFSGPHGGGGEPLPVEVSTAA